MFWLTSLVAMMAIGSLAVIATGPDPIEGSTEEDNSTDHTDAPEQAYDLSERISPFAGLLDQVPPLVDDNSVLDNAPDYIDTGSDRSVILHGAESDDTLRGGDGHDTLFGQDGDDILSGGDGQDALWGGLGQDSLSGNAGNDALHGREGDDHLLGGDNQDTLFGGDGNDLLHGAEARDDVAVDYLNGGNGADHVIAGAGDIVSGGMGADTISLVNWSEAGAELMDFDASEDQLIVFYDEDPEMFPDLTLQLNEDDPVRTEIRLDGRIVAIVAAEQAPALDQIVLMPGTAAQAFDLALQTISHTT